MKILNVVGARPNLMKMAPLLAAMHRVPDIEPLLLHTGQHYDEQMSGIFFAELGLPTPDIYLGIGSGSHAQQTARVMLAFEEVLLAQKPDVVVVVGDVNSTLACALTAVKLGIPVAHVEAGLRSLDRTMPEEINRVLTDAISDFLFTTERTANENLEREGIPAERVFFVGNVMIDTLLQHRNKAAQLGTPSQRGLAENYALVTLHRPANVDNPIILAGLVGVLLDLGLPVVFPVHPRTRKQLELFGLWERLTAVPAIHLLPPQGYLEFLNLLQNARLVLSDSGGIQEETTILGIPCLTLRENTERPITLTEGTNQLVGVEPSVVLAAAKRVLAEPQKPWPAPELWDGQAAQRIVAILRPQ